MSLMEAALGGQQRAIHTPMEGVELSDRGAQIVSPQSATTTAPPANMAPTTAAPESDESSDEEEEPPVTNPSTNIRGDLQKALGNQLTDTFKGSFSYHKTYTDAPNPGLNLLANGIGRIGLPLSEREAKVIISGCKQAPFGKGERTVVDTSVRDTWEMDASQVQFLNPDWNAYVQRVLQDTCAALGVNMNVSQPRCELYKLLLYETGSHFLPHVDTEKVDAMFATIIIVLPSPFTGGAAHLSHGSLSEVYDCAPHSDMKTSAMAWYTDVMHSIKPITSGYRLALSYTAKLAQHPWEITVSRFGGLNWDIILGPQMIL